LSSITTRQKRSPLPVIWLLFSPTRLSLSALTCGRSVHVAIGLGAMRICALSMCALYMRSSLAAMNAVELSAYLAIARPMMVRKLGREFKFSIAFLLLAKSANKDKLCDHDRSP